MTRWGMAAECTGSVAKSRREKHCIAAPVGIASRSRFGDDDMSKPAQTPATGLKGFVGYRPELKVLDCTIRDGGLMNDHHFPHEFVKAVYDADAAGGVDYMEIGYRGAKTMFKSGEHGPWEVFDEED